MLPKAIFIDWDGTLSRSQFWAPRDDSLLDPLVVEQVRSDLFIHNRNLVQNWMRGLMSSTEIVNLLAVKHNIDASALHEELAYSCQHMQFLDQSVIDKVQELRRHGTKVVIATDNMDTFRRWTVPSLHLNIIFDAVICSYDIGTFKNEINNGKSNFFDPYLHSHGLKPSETILLDDRLDTSNVRSLGMGFKHITDAHTLSKELDTL